MSASASPFAMPVEVTPGKTARSASQEVRPAARVPAAREERWWVKGYVFTCMKSITRSVSGVHTRASSS